MEKKRILVVDDNKDLRDLVREFLERKYQAKVTICGDGIDALFQIQQTCDIPDLIITGLEMPIMNGFELIKGVKVHAPGLPIILMTGRPDAVPGSAQADIVLGKPFRLEQLSEAIEALIV
jgi:DNA-binding response OmpR family regulator